MGGRPSDLLLNLALATKLSLVAGPRAAARRHEGAPKDVLDAPVQRAIMSDCSADAARPNLPEPWRAARTANDFEARLNVVCGFFFLLSRFRSTTGRPG